MTPVQIVDQPYLTAERLRYSIMGATLVGLLVLNYVVWTPRPAPVVPPIIIETVTAAHVDLGAHICRAHGGLASVTALAGNIYRFRCRSGTVIEELVTLQ